MTSQTENKIEENKTADDEVGKEVIVGATVQDGVQEMAKTTGKPTKDADSSKSVAVIIKERMCELYEDTKVKQFIPLKLINFLIFGGMTTLFPFLTIFAKSLGILESELGLIYGLLPIIATIGPPIAGMLADKLGNFKYFLSGMVALSGASALLFLTVPVGRIEHPLPESIPVGLTCVGDTASLAVLTNHTCEFSPGLTDWLSTVPCSSNCTGDGNNSTSLELDGENCTSNGAGCFESCSFEMATKFSCTNKVTVEDVNSVATFWLFAIVRAWNGVTLAMSMPLFEGAIVAILKEYNGDFGFQRVYGSLGPIILAPLTGLLIDRVSESSGFTNYTPAFYLYCAIKILCAILILFLDLEFKAPSNSVVKDFVKLITNFEIVIFLLMTLMAGFCYGAIDTFLFWLLSDIGASKQLMGLTVTVGNLCGIPILIFATPLIEKIGCVNTIVAGFSVYTLRFIGYSVIYNPWLCMPFEALECVTFALLITAAITHAADLSTMQTTATLQSIMGGFHHGVGKGLGSLITGFIMAAIGVRGMYQVMAGLATFCALFYFLVNVLCFKKVTKERKHKKEVQNEAYQIEGISEQPELSNTRRRSNNASHKRSTTDDGGAENEAYAKTEDDVC